MDKNPNFIHMQASNLPNTNPRSKISQKGLGLSRMVQRKPYKLEALTRVQNMKPRVLTCDDHPSQPN